ncbi:4'-phosphopantetheinyl transferase superfamily protein [Nocardioides jensenii]|uniref:4'-phosphopantetheinyl transferase superfamily protein n=1 Tax=Nocardioides jensenii TaxID=1843 RepID=UPI00082C53FE|nr:4'-phosphopantetheinyl transferase superfamily protein [Nocardioides jensenii]
MSSSGDLPDDAVADIAWHSRTRDADAALTEHVAGLLAVEAGGIRVGRLCPRCGSDAHGRPWASGARVSLSRAGDHLVTAVATGPVGVDVEVVADVESRWEPALVLHPDDPVDVEPAWAWTAKEAVLKARGTGLAVPMTSVRLADHDVREIPAPIGLAAAVVVLVPGLRAGAGPAARR